MKIKSILHSLIALTLFLIVCTPLLFSSAAHAQSPLGTLRVQVKDFYSAAALQGANITVSPNNYTGTTNDQGEVLINNVTPFRGYQVRAEKKGYIAREVGFVSINANEETTSIIPLKLKSKISGTVRAQDEGSPSVRWPVRDAAVRLGKMQGSTLVGIQTVHADLRGKFTLDMVDEDSYKIIVLKDGDMKSSLMDITATAGEQSSQDFLLTKKQITQPFSAQIAITNPLTGPYTTGQRLYIKAVNPTGIQEYHWLHEKLPTGAVLSEQDIAYFGNPPGATYTFVIPKVGDYSVTLFAVNSEGIVKQGSLNFTAVNKPPEAVPSVIPGSKELPFYESGVVHTNSTGSSVVQAGSTVYLRGFGVDPNLLSTAEFNPGAPTFDIYENKNGDFKASIFTYAWQLQNMYGLDISDQLSPSATSENCSFTIPLNAQPGDTYWATLIVTDDCGVQSPPATIPITVAQATDQQVCSICHSTIAVGYVNTAHASAPGGAGCQDCHGPGSEHVLNGGDPLLSKSVWPGVCGQCHDQFAESQRTNHSDPLPFGYYEPTEGRIKSCYRCHYTEGYIGAVESGVPFYDFRYTAAIIPQIPKDSPNISCSVCHDPHSASTGNPYGLRRGSAGAACDSCHYEKWQNAILEGMAGQVANGYHYPGEDYSIYAGSNNLHRTTDKCVLCHMSRAVTDTDGSGVRKVGGHTLRMRDFGNDQIPGTVDDLLNIVVCQTCHAGLTTFDRNNFQTQVKGLLVQLSNLLKGSNHEFLPPNKPGNCNKCHKGGTVPFLNDPNLVLEHAYTNYKLFLHDRSYGIHNPGYTVKLLQDSINSVQNNYQP